jgi:NTE family protein
MREMRAVAFVTRLIDEGQVAPGTMKRMLIHSIAADDFMQGSASTASSTPTGSS